MKTALAAAVSVLVAGSAFGQTEKVRVYVEPDVSTSEFVDEESKRRSDSHRDLTKHVRGQKEWEVVDDPADAHVVISLISAKEEPIGEKTTRDRIGVLVMPSESTTVQTLPTVRIGLRVGDYEREFKGDGFWSPAALEAVLELRKWTRENRERLLKR